MKKIALMALCLTAFASSANASIVSIEYKGNVSYSNISGVVAGQEYTETFSWDYSLFALDIGSNYTASYAGIGYGVFQSETISFITAGFSDTLTFSDTNINSLTIWPALSFNRIYSLVDDGFRTRSETFITGDFDSLVYQLDLTASGTYAPANASSNMYLQDYRGSYTNYIEGNVTSATLNPITAPVPEPEVTNLLMIGLLGLFLIRRAAIVG